MATSTYIIIMAVCLILSAYFSATETAFSSVNTTKLKALAEKGNKKLRWPAGWRNSTVSLSRRYSSGTTS